MATLENRVAHIAEAVLAERQCVTLLDVLVGLGWLAAPDIERWLSGRVTAHGVCVSADAATIAAAREALTAWAQRCGLTPSENDHGDGDVRIRWSLDERSTPETPQPRRRGLSVISAEYALSCSACSDESDLLLQTGTGALCLDCADLGHLVFLPSGDAALTRRATKASRLSARVFRWNARRNRYERQGVLAEAEAIESAAGQCLADARRPLGVDDKVRSEFIDAIGAQFPGCPPARAEAIAYQAAVRGSGRRVGRRSSDADAVHRAVAASVRHVDTDYDDLLMSGVDRDEAKNRVNARADGILAAWREGVTVLDA